MGLNRIAILGAAVAAGLAAVAAPLLVRAQAAPELTWSARASDDGPDKVQLQLSYRRGETGYSSYGRSVDLAQLAGLSAAQFAGPTTTLVRFRLTRDAGTFDCEGSAKAQFGSGSCDFHENPGFARTLEQRGAGSPQPGQLFDLAISDVGVAYLDELRRQRYATASVDDLVKAAQHGVSLKFLQGMDSAGYRVGDVPSLVRLRDHGVTPKYIGELKAANLGRLSVEDLVRLRDHGVSARYLTDMRAAGYGGLSAEQLIWLRDHGVSSGFVAGLQSLGYTNIPADQLVRLRDHGVTMGFISRVNVDRRLDVEELIQLRDRGGR